MEDPAQGSQSAEERSLQTGAALRALREGLGAKLETHRRRISDLETDVTARASQIAEELSQEQGAELQAALALHEDHLRKLRETLAERDAAIAKLQRQISDAELSHLRLSAELVESRSAIEAVRNEECQDCGRMCAELAAAHKQATHADAQLQELLAQVEQLAQTVAQSKATAATLLAQQSNGESLLAEAQATVEQTQKLLDETLAELEATEEREVLAAARVEDLLAQIDQLTAKLTESQHTEETQAAQQATNDAVLRESRSALEESERLLSDKIAELAAAEDRESQATAQIEALLAQVEQLNDDLARSRDAESRLLAQHSADENALAAAQLATERDNQLLREQLAEVAAKRDSLAVELAQVRAEITAREESASHERSWLEKEFESAEQSRKQLATEFEELLKQHKSTEEAFTAAELQNAQTLALLKRAEEQIVELSDSTAHEAELEQAGRKFELALADAQKLKRDNAELQAELAQRPEKSEAESPELVSLRVERDALAARVAALEATPVPVIDEDAEQRMSDLQRRFELAVEDLRHLKQENAQLQEKLVNAPRGGGPSSPSPGTAMDWQSQKARLLEALESEDAEEESAERRQERITIEGTISITDLVVAEKDREITELRAQVAEQPLAVVTESSAQSDLLDKDELIAAERSKLAQLQKELHEKLRTAELEMSVQRASLARKQAEIEQKLHAAQQSAADAPVGPDGKPRRKWLSALGLRDDDE